MRGLILAAGEGKRAQKATGSYLKCLFPISDRSDTLLGTLISQLHAAMIQDLVIVGGYRYNELQAFISRFCSRTNIYTEYILLDARPKCSQGPIFSFLRAESECSSDNQCLLLPADTLFHPRLFSWLSSLEDSFASFPDKTIHLVYADHLSGISDKTQIIMCNSNSQVSDIRPYKTWKKLSYTSSSSPKVMIPIVIFPGSFFPVARQGVESGFTQVIQLLVDLLMSESEWKIYAHHFKAESRVFQDFDVPTDIKKLEKMLE
ncbi:MAG: NTP transferase domain-containing protein [Promethearchaeota archaeon]